MAVVAMPHNDFIQSKLMFDASHFAEKKTSIREDEGFRVDDGIANNELEVEVSPLVLLLESVPNPTKAQILEAVAQERRHGMSMSTILKSSSSGGWPLLVVAAQRGMSTALLTLLELGAEVDSKEPSSGWTPLMYAVTSGNQGMVRDLLRHGASPNEFAKPSDWNPLSAAIIHNQESIMAMLIDAGANPNLIKRRHPNLLETYSGALDKYQAKCMAEEASKHQKPCCVWVKNAAEYC